MHDYYVNSLGSYFRLWLAQLLSQGDPQKVLAFTKCVVYALHTVNVVNLG